MLRPRDFPETRPSLLATLREDGGLRQSTWREFFKLYAPAVYRVARLNGLGHADADDIVQQVMLVVARHIDNFEYDRDRGSFRQWVRRIAGNKIHDLRRRRRPESLNREELETCPDGRPSLDELWEQQWRLQDLHYCLEEIAADISPRRMQAFRLYALAGVSAAETAEVVGVRVGFVYFTRHQVLNMVRQRLGELDSESDGREANR